MKNRWEHFLDFLWKVRHFVRAYFPWNRVSKEVASERREACQDCPATDPSGHRLYRIVARRPVCGRPADPRAPGFLLEREDELDGCGCWLDLKWRAKGEQCPLGRWHR